MDVSVHQGEIDWTKVADAGIEFAMIRVGYRGYGSEGKMMGDTYFQRNIQSALDAGLKVGVMAPLPAGRTGPAAMRTTLWRRDT